jgi:hypothetical protein
VGQSRKNNKANYHLPTQDIYWKDNIFMQKIFSAKATIVIRAMLAQPDKKWVVRDYESEFGVGRARAAAVLSILRKKGFTGVISSGRLAHSVLQNRKSLLDEWLKYYSFELNKAHLYYSPHGDILPRLKDYFEAKKSLPDTPSPFMPARISLLIMCTLRPCTVI